MTIMPVFGHPSTLKIMLQKLACAPQLFLVTPLVCRRVKKFVSICPTSVLNSSRLTLECHWWDRGSRAENPQLSRLVGCEHAADATRSKGKSRRVCFAWQLRIINAVVHARTHRGHGDRDVGLVAESLGPDLISTRPGPTRKLYHRPGPDCHRSEACRTGPLQTKIFFVFSPDQASRRCSVRSQVTVGCKRRSGEEPWKQV